MKVKITCPKCGSENTNIIENPEGTSPLYRCNRCGHKSNLFPQFGKKEEAAEDGEKIEEDEEDEWEETEEE